MKPSIWAMLSAMPTAHMVGTRADSPTSVHAMWPHATMARKHAARASSLMPNVLPRPMRDSTP